MLCCGWTRNLRGNKWAKPKTITTVTSFAGCSVFMTCIDNNCRTNRARHLGLATKQKVGRKPAKNTWKFTKPNAHNHKFLSIRRWKMFYGNCRRVHCSEQWLVQKRHSLQFSTHNSCCSDDARSDVLISRWQRHQMRAQKMSVNVTWYTSWQIAYAIYYNTVTSFRRHGIIILHQMNYLRYTSLRRLMALIYMTHKDDGGLSDHPGGNTLFQIFVQRRHLLMGQYVTYP